MKETLGLGIDAGGTTSRWALARASGEIVASGEGPGMSALMMKNTDGRNHIRAAMGEIARAAFATGHPTRVQAGITGLADRDSRMRAYIAEPLGLEERAVTLQNDIVFAYLGVFKPGEGYLVYSGTGSVAAHMDEHGVLHRAGGRGHILDDGGSGYWIAREALRHIWREEDCHPGAWERSPMAREIFARMGGADWAHTREAIYHGDRGAVGRLALALADTAADDPVARTILDTAGRELGRLATALVERYGPRPIALTGRAALLHPRISEAMRVSLPPGVTFEARESQAHHAAARLAAAG